MIDLVEFCHNANEAFDQFIGKAKDPKIKTLDLCRDLKGTETHKYQEASPTTRSASFKRWTISQINAAAQALHLDDHIGWMAIAILTTEHANADQRNVEDRITSKLVKGGYGQLPEPIIKAIPLLDANEETRERLRIGWRGSLVPAGRRPRPYLSLSLPGYDIKATVPSAQAEGSDSSESVSPRKGKSKTVSIAAPSAAELAAFGPWSPYDKCDSRFGSYPSAKGQRTQQPRPTYVPGPRRPSLAHPSSVQQQKQPESTLPPQAMKQHQSVHGSSKALRHGSNSSNSSNQSGHNIPKSSSGKETGGKKKAKPS